MTKITLGVLEAGKLLLVWEKSDFLIPPFTHGIGVLVAASFEVGIGVLEVMLEVIFEFMLSLCLAGEGRTDLPTNVFTRELVLKKEIINKINLKLKSIGIIKFLSIKFD